MQRFYFYNFIWVTKRDPTVASDKLAGPWRWRVQCRHCRVYLLYVDVTNWPNHFCPLAAAEFSELTLLGNGQSTGGPYGRTRRNIPRAWTLATSSPVDVLSLSLFIRRFFSCYKFDLIYEKYVQHLYLQINLLKN